MRRKLSIVLALAFCVLPFVLRLSRASGEPAIVELPLSLSGTNPYVATNAWWWTNASVPTNISAWQGWYAVQENFRRMTNWTGTNVSPRISVPTNSAPADTNIVRWILLTNNGQAWAVPAAAWP
jgi:hypothetical protein